MKKSQLVYELAKTEGLTQRMALLIVDIFFNAITEALVNGKRAEIRGFGTFKVKDYDGYTGRNPKSGEEIKVNPKKLPFFKVGKELKERVDT